MKRYVVCWFYVFFCNKVIIYSAWNLFLSQLRQFNVHEIPSVCLVSSYFNISNSVVNNNMKKSISKKPSLCPPVPPKYFLDEIFGHLSRTISRVVHPQKELHPQFQKSPVLCLGFNFWMEFLVHKAEFILFSLTRLSIRVHTRQLQSRVNQVI